jgi:hypothetical protein
VARRSIGRQLERELVRASKRRRPQDARVRRASADPDVLLARTHVDPDWRRVVDGRAARLAPDETIDLRGHGRFADLDPRTVVVGWRSVGRVLGLATWAGAVGTAWWAGGHGRGPFADR